MNSTYVSQSDLARQLEWELSLSDTELVSHAWYHGSVSRHAAECVLVEDGQFLVRDSASQPGDCVLSCRHAGQHLHFVINRVILQPGTVYERVQYQFEDEAYDNVADLVTSYVGSGKPISAASGARMQTPSNRQFPLMCRSSTINSTPYPPKSAGFNNSCASNKPFPLCCGINSVKASPSTLYTAYTGEVFDVGTSPTYMHRGQRSFMPAPADLYKSIHCGQPDINPNDGVAAAWQEWDEAPGSPPAKPSRTAPVYQASGSDSGNGSGDSAQSSAPSEHPDTSRSLSNLGTRDIDAHYVEQILMKSPCFEFRQPSQYNFETFQSNLLSGLNNKPLESDTLQSIKIFLRNSGPRILANHLTSVDTRMILSDNNLSLSNNPLDTVSGLELSLLPHGDQMRMDLIERSECVKLLIAVTILTCTSDHERADVLNDWIQLAIETKTALGNLYGFGAIMLGLCMPQIENLEATWNKLRQIHTDTAFTFESKLRPCFKNMNDCLDPAPPNTTLPHLLPAIMLIHNTDTEKWWGNTFTSWDFTVNSADFGLGVVAAHLENARKFPDQVASFRRNARTVVQEASSLGPVMDPMLIEMFRTEFHIKFLWGARGALASAPDRHNRLFQILASMAAQYPTQPNE